MKTTAYYHTFAILIVILLISSICICPVAAQTNTGSVTIQSYSPSNEIVIDKSKNFEDLGILINAAPLHLVPLPIALECLTIPLTDDLIIHPCFIDNVFVGLATPAIKAQIKTSADLQPYLYDEITEYNRQFHQ